jgi:hypothetical protein
MEDLFFQKMETQFPAAANLRSTERVHPLHDNYVEFLS